MAGGQEWAENNQYFVIPSQVGKPPLGVYSLEGAVLPDLLLPASGDATFRINQTLQDFDRRESNTPVSCCAVLDCSRIAESKGKTFLPVKMGPALISMHQ